MEEPRARTFDGRKFMWDAREYETRAEAEEARTEYEGKSFKVRIVEEDDTVEVYTRRVATEVVVEGSPAI